MGRRRPALLLVLAWMAATFLLTAWLHPGRGDRLLRHAVTVSMTLSCLAAFWAGARLLAAGAPWSAGRALAGFLVLAAAAACVPAFHSSDVHAYGQIGWLQVRYGANPYVVVPAELPEARDDPMFTRTWRERPAIYGFLFAHVARAVAWAGGGDPVRTRLCFRLLSAFAWLAVGALFLASGPRAPPGPGVPASYWLLWSPFVLLHAVSNAHNDGLFALLLLGALLAARRDRLALVLPLFALATLVKWLSLAVLPVALVFLWRRQGARRTLAQLAGALALAGLVSWPYLRDVDAFAWAGIRAQLVAPSYSLVASLGDLATALGFGGAPPGNAPTALEQVLAGALGLAFAGLLVLRVVRAIRSRRYDADALVADVVGLLFALVILASAKFFPWYLLLFLPAALLLPPGHLLRRAVLLLTLTWMLAFTGLGKARIADALVMTALPLAWLWLRARPGRRATARG